ALRFETRIDRQRIGDFDVDRVPRAWRRLIFGQRSYRFEPNGAYRGDFQIAFFPTKRQRRRFGKTRNIILPTRSIRTYQTRETKRSIRGKESSTVHSEALPRRASI